MTSDPRDTDHGIAQSLRAAEERPAFVPEHIELCIARATGEEGGQAFRVVHESAARAAASALASAARLSGPLSGIPISIKDNIDEAGHVTVACSKTRLLHPVAGLDAPVVARLREAGAVVIGRTTMSEFAYSGVGTNPHFGTPLNPYDRASRRIPGGSSSGAVVSVSEGACLAAIGTDTGGSMRIPAALCGKVGFKPTAATIPLEGVLPLSQSLDSVGVIASTVDCVRRVFRAVGKAAPGGPSGSVRLIVPTNHVLESADPHVASAFERSLSRLAAAGVGIVEKQIAAFDIHRAILAAGGLVAPEAFRNLREPLSTERGLMDPRVVRRALAGATVSQDAFLRLLQMRSAFQEAMHAMFDSATDAIAMPTVPIVAPRLSEIAEDESHERINRLLLRNPSSVNMLNGCAITLPCAFDGETPAGLMLAMPGGRDEMLLAIAEQLQPLLKPL